MGSHLDWSSFSKFLCCHFDWKSLLLGRLTKICQPSMVKKFITTFDKLAIYTKNLSYEIYIECFIGGLKDTIRAHVRGHHPHNWLESCQWALEAETILTTQNPHSTFTSKSIHVPLGTPTRPLKIQHLSPKENEDRQWKGLCYKYIEKYVKCHRYRK